MSSCCLPCHPSFNYISATNVPLFITALGIHLFSKDLPVIQNYKHSAVLVSKTMQHLPVSITQELSDMVLFQHTVQAISKHLDYLPVYKQTGMHFTQISETA